MRGLLRTIFYLNLSHQFLHCTFRLRKFFITLISSDFALVPNLSFPLDIIYKGEIFYRDLFSPSRNLNANFVVQLKNGSNFGTRERKYAKTWDGGGRARGHKSFQFTSSVLVLYLQLIVFTPLSLLCSSKVATEMRIHNFFSGP